jgi:hypothetical protein
MPDSPSGGSAPQARRGEAPEPAPALRARERLDELFARVDAFFTRVEARHPGGLTCHAGCDDCCRRRFSVTALEAEVLAEGLARLPPDARAALARRAADGGDPACPALEPDGRCAVYASRPLICRTHGLPIRFASPRSLPVVDACPRNFGGVELADIAADCVLDQATLSTVLGALDAARAAEAGRPRGERVEIAALIKPA